MEVKMTKEGRVKFYVYLKENGGINMAKVAFKVDTGADITVISREHLRVAGYSDIWVHKNMQSVKGFVTGAGGHFLDLVTVSIPLINVAGHEIKSALFHTTKNPKGQVRNLLGLDVLSAFDFAFINSENIFRIKKHSYS
jgi:predicted aspartyl protease